MEGERDEAVYRFVMSQPLPERLLKNLQRADVRDEQWLDKTEAAAARWKDSSELTAEELRVLRALAVGLNLPQVADAYGASFYAMRHHLKSARYKLRAKNQTHAVANAIRRGLI